MTNHDKSADDIAHERFKAAFNKLFGVKPKLSKRGAERQEQRRRNIESAFPTSDLRKAYDGADEGGKVLMLLEKVLEAMVEPARLEKRALLAKLEADNRAMRAQLDAYKVEFEKIERDFAEIKKRDQEARSRMFNARPFALDVNNPYTLEIALEAVRANPALLDRLNKPH